MTSLAANFADSAIGAYQRYLSPHKGFCCAYRVHTGRRSCSAYARGVTQRLGLFALVTALPKQFSRCKTAYQSMQTAIALENNNKNNQRKEDENICKDFCDPCQAATCFF
ncbi:membrane protein insertion efficiency factor YidD [Variovorax sp. PCZ-1]|nr:membrane protein insertion efficiency factor YidD [Variovorax sp. PCZ-1]